MTMPNKVRNSLTKRLRPKTTLPFESLGDVKQTPHGVLVHQDNGADVLAVAHLDYVQYSRAKYRDTTVYCPQLDDRLGVWVILDVLKSRGMNVDVLLTDSEEIGQSTAQYFETPKRYNWMFQFDRAGTDCVMYDYHNGTTAGQLTDCGIEVNHGAFSDICHLESLGIVGINFGVGYHAQHTEKCYADLRETMDCLEQFERFYHQYRDVKMPWEPSPKAHWWGQKYEHRATDFGDDNAEYWQCPYCYSERFLTRDGWLCWDCDSCEIQEHLAYSDGPPPARQHGA
jgi:hypothetical protein